MNEMTLFSLTEDYKQLLMMAYDEDIDEQCFVDTLEGLQGAIEVKAEGYAKVNAKLDADVNAIKNEIARLEKMESVLINRQNNLKANLMFCMNELGIKSIKTELHNITVKGNGGLQPLIITGEVPERFKKIILEDDKAKIRQALKDGEKLGFATLAERGKHIEIK